jgi:hypothetical protein
MIWVHPPGFAVWSFGEYTSLDGRFADAYNRCNRREEYAACRLIEKETHGGSLHRVPPPKSPGIVAEEKPKAE